MVEEKFTIEDILITEAGINPNEQLSDTTIPEQPSDVIPEVPSEPIVNPLDVIPSDTITSDVIDEDGVETPLISELNDFYGFGVEGEYTDDVEGLKTFIPELANKMAMKEFEDFYDKYPIAGEFNQYIANGGDPDKFFKVNFSEPDYGKVELGEDNLVQAREVVKAFSKKQGFDEGETLGLIKDYEDTGILHKQATVMLPKLVASQKQQKEDLKTSTALAAKQSQEESEQAWKNIGGVIESGNLQGISIPEAEKKGFFDWMAVPNEEGKSALQVAEDTMTLEQMLTMRYLLYKNIDFSKLATTKRNTQQAESLRVTLGKAGGNKMKGSKASVGRQDEIFTLENQFSR